VEKSKPLLVFGSRTYGTTVVAFIKVDAKGQLSKIVFWVAAS